MGGGLFLPHWSLSPLHLHCLTIAHRCQPERPDRSLRPARGPAVPGGEHRSLAHRPLVPRHHRQTQHPAGEGSGEEDVPLTSTSLGLARRLLVLGRVRIPREATRAMSPLLDGTTAGGHPALRTLVLKSGSMALSLSQFMRRRLWAGCSSFWRRSASACRQELASRTPRLGGTRSGSCPTAAPYSLGSISIHVSSLPGGTEGIVLQSSVSFRDAQEDPHPTDPPQEAWAMVELGAKPHLDGGRLCFVPTFRARAWPGGAHSPDVPFLLAEDLLKGQA